MGEKAERKNKKAKLEEIFEYEDFGTPTLYLWTALVVIIMLALLVVLAMLVAGRAVAISEALNG